MSEPLRPSSVPEPALQTAARLLAEGRPAEAAAHLAALTAEAPTYAAAHVLHATALEADGRPDAAVEAWGQAAFLVPRSPLVRRERQRLLDTPPAGAPEPLETEPSVELVEAETPAEPAAFDDAQVEADGVEAEADESWDTERDGEPEAEDLDDLLQPEPETVGEASPSDENSDPEEATPGAAHEPESGQDPAPDLFPPDALLSPPPAPADEPMPPDPEGASPEPAVLETMELSEFDLDFDPGSDDLDLGHPDGDPSPSTEWAPEPAPANPAPAETPAEPAADWGDLPPTPGPDLLVPEPPDAAPPPPAPEAADAEGWRVLEEEGPAPDDAPPPAAPPSVAVEADLVAPEGDLSPSPPTFEVADELDALISQLEQAPRIRPDPTYSGPSVKFDESGVDEMVSETLAKIYAAQHRYVEAAVMYEKLAAREPEQAEELLRRAAELREKR